MVVKYLLLVVVTFIVVQIATNVPALSASKRLETRCGWYVNPTPANAWLFDRHGRWTIGLQGGYQAEGSRPDFTPQQWVETNQHYGYGCACMRVRVNHQTRKILEIKSAYAKPLKACRQDRSLKEPI
ncbi:hypothetical protein UH38_18935 [Aliterella atlantica CENA595]|uniref:DUF4087 domain-containing protein n=1 Tax=Aliterella atlantica CENA595 TaxID=1618023 RepID=A0A0D8ZNH4_9CYAN|nr:hypothetical protein UH38_18935 [Aliterella atlantica CENA595]